MGVDINGWVEIQPHSSHWYGAIRLDAFSLRMTELFQSLFGVRVAEPFQPIAPSRGLPPNISEAATVDYLTWDVVFGESWINWSELQTVDWSEEILDPRPHHYKIVDGELAFRGYGANVEPEHLIEGATWTVDEYICRIETTSRQFGLDQSRDWRLLFTLMENLANVYGSDNVRLVVWFDC